MSSGHVGKNGAHRPNRPKLSPELAAEIRSVTDLTIEQLAAKYGVSATTIKKIRSGRIYKNARRQ